MTKLDAALALSARGLAVFPCWPNKKTPITKRSCLEATRDVEVIEAWWGPRGWPAANIAVATGAPSDVVVLDVDVKGDKNGEADLVDLDLKHNKLPHTVEAITPSKGRHLYFKMPGRPVPCSVGKIARGLDIRSTGGYVLVPPSSAAGKYIWSVDSAASFAELPAWLLEQAAPVTREPRPPGYFSEIAGGVPEGKRNESLASLCGKLLRVGLPASEVLAYLRFWNERNAPPLDDGRLVTAVKNIAARELERCSR